MMNENTLQTLLRPRPVRYFVSTGSTNTDAAKWLGEMPFLANGAVVLADEQTAGRGRYDRQWVTPSGSAIAMSIVLRTKRPTQNITTIGSIAVAEALEPLVPESRVTIKWPNDVLVDGKKICGILAEAVWQHDKLVAVILGIGINITIDFSATELADKATSLRAHTAQPVDRPKLIKGILDGVDKWMAASNELVHRAWKTRLATLHQQVTMEGGFKGEAVDVDNEGALLVKSATGTMKRFVAGDVSDNPAKEADHDNPGGR